MILRVKLIIGEGGEDIYLWDEKELVKATKKKHQSSEGRTRTEWRQDITLRSRSHQLCPVQMKTHETHPWHCKDGAGGWSGWELFLLAQWGDRLTDWRWETKEDRDSDYTWTFWEVTQADIWLETPGWPQMNYSCRKLGSWKLIFGEVCWFEDINSICEETDGEL